MLLTGRTEVEQNKFLNFKSQGNRRGWITPLRHQLKEGRTPEQKAASEKSLATALEQLASHKDEIWFGTFPACAKYGQSRDTAELTSKRTGDKIVINLRDRMDDELFDEPLTVKVRLPDGWKTVRAKQGKGTVPARLVTHDGAIYALVDIVPDRGEVSVER